MSEEKKQVNENIALKNVSPEKAFFEGASPKLTFFLGLVIGIAIFSLIGFIYLLSNGTQKSEKKVVENKEFVPIFQPPTTPPPSDGL